MAELPKRVSWGSEHHDARLARLQAEALPAPDRLSVTRDQAMRLFSATRVVDVEMVDELVAWTFAGGIVLVLNHMAEPPEFTLAVDGDVPAGVNAAQEVPAHA